MIARFGMATAARSAALLAVVVAVLAIIAAGCGDDSSPSGPDDGSAEGSGSPTISPSPTLSVVLADMGCESEIGLWYAEQFALEGDDLLVSGLYSVGVDGSGLRCLAAAVEDYWWSGDGRRLAASYLQSYYPQPVTASPRPSPGPLDPVWLITPWPRTIAPPVSPTLVAPTLGVYDMTTDSWTQVYLGPWRSVFDAQWSSDGEILAVSVRNTEDDQVTEIWIIRDSGTTQELLTTLTEPFAWIRWAESDLLSVVASESCCAVASESGEPRRLLVIDIATGAEKTIARWSTPEGTPVLFSWSPESDRLALISERDGAMATLRVADLVSGEVKNLHQFEDDEERVDLGTRPPYLGSTWSPDGQHIAVATDERMLLIAADGSGVVSVAEIDSADQQIESWNWSPDGRSLAIEVGTKASAFESDILIAELDGPAKLVEGGDIAKWSPDGSKLLFVRGLCSDQEDLFVLDLAAGTEHIISLNKRGPYFGFEWIAAGERVSFYDLRSDTIFVVDLQGDEISKITPGGIFTLSPDESRLALQPLGPIDFCT